MFDVYDVVLRQDGVEMLDKDHSKRIFSRQKLPGESLAIGSSSICNSII
jgi:hypothetical protein